MSKQKSRRDLMQQSFAVNAGRSSRLIIRFYAAAGVVVLEWFRKFQKRKQQSKGQGNFKGIINVLGR